MDSFDIEDARDQLERAFRKVIGPNPRQFGTRSRGHLGVSDGNEGVQWNTWVDSDPMESGLGVNLEGLMYDDWPIARFIERELARPTIFDVVATLSEAKNIGLTWSRDYWQRAARPPIKERRIVYRLPLDQLRPAAWRDYLLAARDCLDSSRGYHGRGRQTVTLIPSGKRVTDAQVSPHLHFARMLGPDFFSSNYDSQVATMNRCRGDLEPLYQFVKQRTNR